MIVLIVKAFARPDIRVRVRGGVIRVRVSEARFRAVIRIAAEMNTTLYATDLFLFLSIILLEIVTVALGAQCHSPRERVQLLYLLKDIQNIC